VPSELGRPRLRRHADNGLATGGPKALAQVGDTLCCPCRRAVPSQPPKAAAERRNRLRRT